MRACTKNYTSRIFCEGHVAAHGYTLDLRWGRIFFEKIALWGQWNDERRIVLHGFVLTGRGIRKPSIKFKYVKCVKPQPGCNVRSWHLMFVIRGTSRHKKVYVDIMTHTYIVTIQINKLFMYMYISLLNIITKFIIYRYTISWKIFYRIYEILC